MTATTLALLFVLGLTLSAAPGALDATGGELSMVAAAYVLGVLVWAHLVQPHRGRRPVGVPS